VSIERKIVDQHTEWMRENAYGLRMLDGVRRLNPASFGSESIRDRAIEELGSQIVVDAFRRGLGIIALSPPQYFVERFMGAWTDSSRPIAPEPAGWLPALPPADMIDADSRILIKIEAFGFPIGPREV
jgi:hypothetical protein